MFERYLSEALAIHFGQYIENFDADKVKISVWNGEVILKDLKLKRDALQHLMNSTKGGGGGDNTGETCDSSNNNNSTNAATADETNANREEKHESSNNDDKDDSSNISSFPCQIEYGHIGTFELHIPWSLFRHINSSSNGSGDANNTSSSSNWSSLWRGGSNVRDQQQQQLAQTKEGGCSITLSDVNILIHPSASVDSPSSSSNHHKKEEEKENIEQQQQRKHQLRIEKERQVEKILDEALFRKNIETTQSEHIEQESNNQKSQFVQSLIKNIVSSLSITVRNVHIRYEDPGDCLGFHISNCTEITTTNTSNNITSNNHNNNKHNNNSAAYNGSRRQRCRPPFAIGITLKEFSLYSTDHGPLSDDELYNVPTIAAMNNDSNFTPQPSQHHTNKEKNHDIAYTTQNKLAAAVNLSVYWDSHLTMNEMIHLSVKKNQRRRQQKGSFEEKKVDAQKDLTDDEEVFVNSFNERVNIHDDDDGGVYNNGNDRIHDSGVNDDFNEYDLIYARRLNDVMDIPCIKERHKSIHRTYIVKPISPSLHFTIISVLSQEDPKIQQEKYNRNDSNTLYVPPSRAVLTLPPFQSNISKDTIEDLTYLRKSVALWKEMKSSLLSHQVYEKLMKLRPNVSAEDDPKRWWLYAFEAVKTLSKLQNDDSPTSHIPSNGQHRNQIRRKQGWLGLSQRLRLQQNYMNIYQQLLECDNELIDQKTELSNQLSHMEDMLNIKEIIAFRISLVHRYILQLKEIDNDRDPSSQYSTSGSSRWSSWISPWRHSRSDAKIVRDEINEPISQNENDYRFFNDSEMLSWRHRVSIFDEMTEALGMENEESCDILLSDIYGMSKTTGSGITFLKDNVTSGNKLEVSIISPLVTLQADDVVVDRTASRMHHCEIRRRRPIVQLTFASIQKFCLRRDFSWDVCCTFASFEVLNMTDHTSTTHLLTRKQQAEFQSKLVRFGSTSSHFHSATVLMRKDNVDTCDPTMSVSIVVMPVQATYCPQPFHALSKLFSSAKTTELTSDYQRLRSVLSSWQARQKQRLMKVLLERKEKLIIKLDVAAPVLFMHDETSKGTLMVDLGRLTFYNLEEADRKRSYDDGWKLLLADVQAVSLPRPEWCKSRPEIHLVEHDATSHIIEPFTLHFNIHTKIASDEWVADETNTPLSSEILIDATLPRLVFNLTSSSVRLVNRLVSRRNIIKTQQGGTNTGLPNKLKTDIDIPHRGNRSESNLRKSTIKFDFSAPLISLSLTNDVDGHLYKTSRGAQHIQSVTPIAELVVLGIGGKVLHSTFASDRDNEVVFISGLKALYAKDLYQEAGKDFSFLLSSQQPDMYHQRPISSNESFSSYIDNNDTKNDLVQIEYEARKDALSGQNKNDLKIKFHELFVEWNPETLAALQKAMRLSIQEKDYFNQLPENLKSSRNNNQTIDLYDDEGSFFHCESSDDSTAFFDTMDDVDYHFESFEPDYASGEIVDNKQYSFDAIVSPMMFKAVEAISTGQRSFEGHFWAHKDAETQIPMGNQDLKPKEILCIYFYLTKLRVRFNKESRFRRLIVAEMSATSVHYETKPNGGSAINAKVGNLTLTDPSHLAGSTLYGEILGIKRDVSGMASLLEISFETFPRIEEVPVIKPETKIDILGDPRSPVVVDVGKGAMYGCDAYISLHFSPMRFVLLEQLWLEIIDYFFEGIIGDEVFGKLSSKEIDVKDKHQQIISDILSLNKAGTDMYLPGADAKGVRFRLFQIVMDTPTIIMPVSYRSPQHLSFDINNIHISNRFNCKIERVSGCSYKQWYNNCNIQFCGLTLSSWCGFDISINSDPKSAERKLLQRGSIPLDINITWPTGPYAPIIAPKWKIHFEMKSVR